METCSRLGTCIKTDADMAICRMTIKEDLETHTVATLLDGEGLEGAVEEEEEEELPMATRGTTVEVVVVTAIRMVEDSTEVTVETTTTTVAILVEVCTRATRPVVTTDLRATKV